MGESRGLVFRIPMSYFHRTLAAKIKNRQILSDSPVLKFNQIKQTFSLRRLRLLSQSSQHRRICKS